MTSAEIKTTAAMAGLFAIRMLALFMILPVLQLYLDDYQGSSMSAGWVIGVYGLTQAALQLPLGYLSDKYGRKPIIIFGLGLFVLGSLIAALSHSMLGLFMGRALQGAGAIGSTILALTADLTRPEIRTKAMAIIGISIGFSFLLAMMIAPLVTTFFGLQGIFWFTLVLGLLGILWFLKAVPNTKEQAYFKGGIRSLLSILKNTQVLRLNLSVLFLHAQFSAIFLYLPAYLKQRLQLPESQMWAFYVPVLFAALLFMGPMLRFADKRRFEKGVMILGILLLAASHAALGFYPLSSIWIYGVMAVFFAAFNLLEAQLPSWVSKIVPPNQKGASLGLYSTFQFFGIFLGSVVGGILNQSMGMMGVSLWCVLLLLLWLIGVLDLKSPNLATVEKTTTS